MDKDKIVQRLNKIENLIDSLRVDLLDEDLKKKSKFYKNLNKESKNDSKEITVSKEEIKEYSELAAKYSLPEEEEFINDIVKIVKYNNISLDKLEQVFSNIKRANEKQPKDDIQKYTFSCLHRIREE